MSKLWISIIKNNKYFFSILALIVVFIAFLITDLVITINFPNLSAFPHIQNATERLGIYYSYFTTQTNYLVVIYLFFVLIVERVDKKFKLNFNLLLAITVYITVTMFVFWIGLVGDAMESGLQDYWSLAYAWVKTVILHLIVPIIMITAFILISGKNKISYKTYYKLYMWLILVYPTLYLTAVMIRGDLRFQEGYLPSTCFPYFFLNYHNNGILVFSLAIFLILIFIIGLQHFYIWVNNLRYKKISQRKALEQKQLEEKLVKAANQQHFNSQKLRIKK